AVVVQRRGYGETGVDARTPVPELHRERVPAVVAMPVLDLLGRLDDLVDEVAQVQHEADALTGRRALVLMDHPPVGIERTLRQALAAHEGEARRARIVRRRRGERAADAAAVAVLVHEAVPVLG